MSIILTPITSGYNLSKINSNFQSLESYLNTSVLIRANTGVSGETLMYRDLDMNSYNILNAYVGDIPLSQIAEETNNVAMALKDGGYGYKTVDSFQIGATINYWNEVLRWKLPDGNGEYYRWDGALPKVVPVGSTPATTGGVGVGAWLSVGDATLRTQLASPTGYQLIPSIQIQAWKAEGDIRGWGATNGGFNDAAIESALASSATSIKLGGVGFVSKTLGQINMRSNKTIHSGTINAQFAAGTIQGNYGILLADLTNAKVINVEVTGTLDGGIRFYGGSNLVIDGCYVHDMGVSLLAGECGLAIWGGDYANYRTTYGALIQNCVISNIGGVGIMRGDGILVYKAEDVIIQNNSISAVNRMGIAAGSDCRFFNINNNYITDTLLCGIDIEPDASYPCSNFKIYENVINGFSSRYFTQGAGVGQTFGIDVHSNTAYIKVFKNTLSSGLYGTEAFHIGNNAQEIDIDDNDVIGGAATLNLFIKTYDGSGSKFIRITRNRAKAVCKSFADIAMSEDVYLNDNVFSGNSSANTYFLRVATTLGLNVSGNRSSATTNFILSSSSGALSQLKFQNNNVSTLSVGISLTASGALSDVMINGNSILCPASVNGISIGITGVGTVNALRLKGNEIPLGSSKIIVPVTVSSWDTLTKNNRGDVATAYPGMQLFELSSNKNIQFLNGSWMEP